MTALILVAALGQCPGGVCELPMRSNATYYSYSSSRLTNAQIKARYPNIYRLAAYDQHFARDNGLPYRFLDLTLWRIAQFQANAMAREDKMGHEIAGTLSERLKLARWRGRAVENISYGYKTTKEAFAGWEKSPGHKKNMMKPYPYCGFGQATAADGTIYRVAIYGYKY